MNAVVENAAAGASITPKKRAPLPPTLESKIRYVRDVYEEPETDPYLLTRQAECILLAIDAADVAVDALVILVGLAADRLGTVCHKLDAVDPDEVVDIMESSSIDLLQCLGVGQLIEDGAHRDLTLVHGAVIMLQLAKVEVDKLALVYMHRRKGDQS